MKPEELKKTKSKEGEKKEGVFDGLKNFYNKTKTKMDKGVDAMHVKMNELEKKLMQTDEKNEK